MLNKKLGEPIARLANYFKTNSCLYSSYSNYIAYFQDNSWDTFSEGCNLIFVLFIKPKQS